MSGYTKPKYFKPNDLIHNASNFNRLPIEKQYLRNSKNLVNEALLKQSLKNTLKKTDVWRNDALIFRLNGAGACANRHLREINSGR